MIRVCHCCHSLVLNNPSSPKWVWANMLKTTSMGFLASIIPGISFGDIFEDIDRVTYLEKI